MFSKTPPILQEFISLLYWTMLAACTVGPGTVVTFARAGSEYGLSLIWALVFATVLAYTLLEGTARLTIVSGMSLGQCLRVKYKNTANIYNTALICWLVAISVYLGNTFYQLNCWAGGIDAILAIPGTDNSTTLRVLCCIGYAVIVLVLLYWDKTDKLGVFLGIVMIGMAVLFLIVVIKMGVDWESLGTGFLPNIPDKRENAAEPTDMILSLVSTTAIGFNLFLGGSMAEGRQLKSAQRGIAFSTFCAFLVSSLILIIGSGDHGNEIIDEFEIADIADAVSKFFGTTGVVIYSLGFISAALSSMLTVCLGAALTADSLFSADKDQKISNREVSGTDTEGIYPDALKPAAKDETIQNREVKGIDNQGLASDAENQCTDVKTEISSLTETKGRKMPRWIYLGIMFSMVFVSTVVISANVDRKLVILIAQVFNGILLPFFCICLLLCINDQSFMAQSPQKGWSNVFLSLTVTITLFLAYNVVIHKVFGSSIEAYVKFSIAGGLALVTMIALSVVTSLGRDLLRSFRTYCWTNYVKQSL